MTLQSDGRVSIPDEVRLSRFDEDKPPLVVEPSREIADSAGWALSHRDWIQERLLQIGAILFRGFGIDSPEGIEAFSKGISTDFPAFDEESSPRHGVRGPVQTSTDYPAAYPIQFHNEFSYARRWPMKIFFCCTKPAAKGGETPIADSRKVLLRISAGTLDLFQANGVLYRRNYMGRVGVSWQKAFLTDEKSEVERRCRNLGIDWEWRPKDRLTTTQVAAAVCEHPLTRQRVWFNHGFFFNVGALEPEAIRRVMLRQPENSLSTNTYHGDGAPIDPEVIEEIRAAYADEAATFSWERETCC